MENEREEMLPSYADVVRETGVERERNFNFLCDVVFMFIDVILTMICIAVFIIIRYTDAVKVYKMDASKYCNDTTYYASPPTESNCVFAYGLIAFTFAVSSLVILLKGIIEKRKAKKVMSKLLLHIWILGIHILCVSITIDLLKLCSGVLRPYFFSSQHMKSFYCDHQAISSESLQQLEKSLRTSFPSYRSTIYGFCVTFLYFFLDHFDVQIGIHASQQFITIVLLYLISGRIYDFWLHGENHLNDIIVGLLIGITQAAITVRSMFGSVLHQAKPNQVTPIPVEAITDTQPSAPPDIIDATQDFAPFGRSSNHNNNNNNNNDNNNSNNNNNNNNNINNINIPLISNPRAMETPL